MKDMLSRIKAKFILYTTVSVLIALAGVICLLFIENKTFCCGIIAIGIAACGISYYRFGNKNMDNTYVVTAECISKSRSGYRKQYIEYYFKTETDKSFKIKTTQPEKFKRNMRYCMCFRKNKKQTFDETSEIIGSDLIYFELC